MTSKTIETSDAIAKYAIEGMMNKENDKFIDRLAIILTNNTNLLNMLVCGVPVSVKVTNEDLIIKNIDNAKSVNSAYINDNFEVMLNVVKIRKRYFKTQEEADNSDSWGGNNKYSEETPICREFEYNNTEYLTGALKDAVEIEYL